MSIINKSNIYGNANLGNDQQSNVTCKSVTLLEDEYNDKLDVKNERS